MRAFWLVSACVLGLLASDANAQTMVEYGAAAGASATAASAAKGVGNSIGGLFGGLNKALDQTQNQPTTVRLDPAPDTRTAGPAAARTKSGARIKFVGPIAPPPPPPSYEDAMGIQKNMSCEEVVRRFGPPAMSFASEDDARTMSYSSKAGGVQVECQGGKVASVEKPS